MHTDITFIHSGFLDIALVGDVSICNKNDARYSDNAFLYVVVIRRVSILVKVALQTVPI